MGGFSLNKVQIIGRLGKDPETRHFQNGGSVCNLSVACEETWRDKNSGERKSKTEWVRIAIFQEGLVKIAEQYLRKGSMVYIEGKMQTRSWEKDGSTHYATEVVLQGFGGSLGMLGDPNGNRGGGGDSQSGDDDFGDPSNRRDPAPSGRGSSGAPRRGGVSTGRHNDMDDDIPFRCEWR